MGFTEMFRLRKPCGNCPFRKTGAIELQPGRLEGIVADLRDNDMSTFQCHKTVHNSKTGGEWSEEGDYEPSGNEAMCAGAILYLEKIGRPSVGMRIGRVLGVYDPRAVVGDLRDDL